MKKITLLILCFLGTVFINQAFGQATDGVCDPPSSVDPLTAAAVTEVCSDGSTMPAVTFAAPIGTNVTDVEMVVEVNGAIVAINTDGAIDPTTLAVGDQVCVTAVAYDLAGIQGIISTVEGLCSNPITAPIVEGQVPGACAAVDALVAAGGVTSLEDAFNFAATFGAPIGSVADAEVALNDINVAIGGLLGNICYATTAAECYTIIECSTVACAVEADLMAAPATPVFMDAACDADGVTLISGSIEPITCPTGSTAEYSVDGGTTWAATVPTYDDVNPITVTVRCLCDEDMLTASPTAEITTVPGVCVPASGCTVDAGEPSPATADVCSDALSAVDVTAVFADPGVAGTPSLNQNYIIVDPTNANDIITVSNTAVLDLTGLAIGDQACVVSVAYTQETLDIVTAFVDAQLGSICVPITGPCASDFIGPFGTLDLSGFLNGLNGAFETFGFNFTSDDIALWCINQEITLPLSAIPGGLFSDLVIDLTTIPGLEPDGFCCDFSTATHCLTVIDCSMAACAVAADLAAAPAAPIFVDAACDVDGVTLISGSIEPITCPTGSTAEYSVDGGTTWAATVPTYDDVNPITVTVRCLCDEDMMTASPTAEITTVPGACMPMAGCTALAGEPIITPEQVCLADAGAFDLSTKFDPATGAYDDGAGSIDPVNTNYVAVDQATGEILSVATSAATIDLSAAPVGTVACVYQLAYTQALLDDVTTFLDDLLCNTLCVPITGPCLGDVGYCPGVTPAELAPFLDILNTFFGFNETQICDFLDNQIITIPDPTGLIGDQMIDLAANGLDFCADKSNAPYCVEIIDCSTTCDAVAPVISNDGGDCAAGDTNGDMNNTPFVFAEDGTGNATAPYITEYIVLDGATGNIIGVFPSIADAETAANTEATTNGDACIQAINHNSTEFDALVAALDVEVTNALGIGLCALIGAPCPNYGTLENLYNAIAGFIPAPGITIAGVEQLLMGDLNGLGIPLVVPVPSFCYVVSAEDCITVAACPAGVAGCTDPCSPNYDATATMDDGSCQPQLLGCTDPAAPEYDPTALCDDGTCTPTTQDIPTLSEWGLITLALLLMTFGSVKMAVGSTSLAGSTGSRSIPVPGGNSFKLPFNANLFRRTSMFTGILAFVGFAICAAIFGAIFLPDVIGVLIAGPIFAYLAHLLILLEKNHKS